MSISTYHLSCRSSAVKEWENGDVLGLIIYSSSIHKSKALGELKILPGYVYIRAGGVKEEASGEKTSIESKLTHAQLFSDLFDMESDKEKDKDKEKDDSKKKNKMVCAGIQRLASDKRWKFNSLPREWKQSTPQTIWRAEELELAQALYHWETGGEQNWTVRRVNDD